jgi:hypothetical protein
MRTLLAKAVGILGSVSSGLACGKEVSCPHLALARRLRV